MDRLSRAEKRRRILDALGRLERLAGRVAGPPVPPPFAVGDIIAGIEGALRARRRVDGGADDGA